jgi:hypothetical protein
MRARPRRSAIICAGFAFVLSAGTAEIVSGHGRSKSLLAAAGVESAAAAVAGGMGFNEFLAAVRATRILPSKRVWWHRKGDHVASPKAHMAVAPKLNKLAPSEDLPAAYAAMVPSDIPWDAPEQPVSPIAFPAIAGPAPFVGGPGIPGLPGIPPQAGIPPAEQPNPPPPPPPSPVPEPATWLLMILGMGAVGASLRRRERPVKAVY